MIGVLGLSITVLLFLYYLFWVLVLPWLPPNSSITDYFPDTYWAFTVPTYGLILSVCTGGTMIGLLLVSEEDKSKQK